MITQAVEKLESRLLVRMTSMESHNDSKFAELEAQLRTMASRGSGSANSGWCGGRGATDARSSAGWAGDKPHPVRVSRVSSNQDELESGRASPHRQMASDGHDKDPDLKTVRTLISYDEGVRTVLKEIREKFGRRAASPLKPLPYYGRSFLEKSRRRGDPRSLSRSNSVPLDERHKAPEEPMGAALRSGRGTAAVACRR